MYNLRTRDVIGRNRPTNFTNFQLWYFIKVFKHLIWIVRHDRIYIYIYVMYHQKDKILINNSIQCINLIVF